MVTMPTSSIPLGPQPVLEHAETYYAKPDLLGFDRSAEWVLVWYWRPFGLGRPLPERNIADGPGVPTYVNAGRWLVDCRGCAGAVYAPWFDPYFWCPNCENYLHGGKWLKVVWPNTTAIEAFLSARPTWAMHWLPGESRKDLLEQDQAAEDMIAGGEAHGLLPSIRGRVAEQRLLGGTTVSDQPQE